MRQEIFYAGYGLDQFQEQYPNLSPKTVLLLAKMTDVCSRFFNPDGDIVEIEFKNGSRLSGIIRNCWWNLGSHLGIELERRNPEFSHPNRFYRDNEKLIEIPILDIRSVRLLKKGNERLSQDEQDLALKLLYGGLDQFEIVDILANKQY